MSLFGRQSKKTSVAPESNALESGLKKSRGIMSGLGSLLRGKTALDDDLYDELLDLLLTADVGVSASQRIIDQLRSQAKAEKVRTDGQLLSLLRTP